MRVRQIHTHTHTHTHTHKYKHTQILTQNKQKTKSDKIGVSCLAIGRREKASPVFLASGLARNSSCFVAFFLSPRPTGMLDARLHVFLLPSSNLNIFQIPANFSCRRKTLSYVYFVFFYLVIEFTYPPTSTQP